MDRALLLSDIAHSLVTIAQGILDGLISSELFSREVL